MSKSDGDHAFPQPYPMPAGSGMSLRDYFAGQALTGLLVYSGALSFREISK